MQAVGCLCFAAPPCLRLSLLAMLAVAFQDVLLRLIGQLSHAKPLGPSIPHPCAERGGPAESALSAAGRHAAPLQGRRG